MKECPILFSSESNPEVDVIEFKAIKNYRREQC